MGNILVIVFAAGFEFLARINPNFENFTKFRNYSYIEILYNLIEQQASRFKLNFPYMVPTLIAALLLLISLVGSMLFGKIFNLVVLLYCFRELPQGSADNVFVEFNERYFANLLYFSLFGSFAVLLYNFVAVARVQHQDLNKIHAILAWVPARLASFSFALVGKFAPVFKIWLSQAANIQVSSSKILTDCGLAGVDADDKQVAERALIAWAVLCIVILIL
jgi:hypothetical protein